LLELRRQGVTILVVEQNVHRALAAADRTYVLNSGAVVMGGRSAELHGAAEFEAAYFGLGRGRGAP
jgi:branched-chain amino acid transport system ATP-binding protein